MKVTTQTELDKAIADGEDDIIIDSPAGVWLKLESRGSSRVVAWGSSSVVAWDSSRVEAWGSSSVEARGSSRVEAWGSSSVVAWGSSSVVAWGSSRVEAAKYVAVHLFSQRVTLSGGVLIDMTKVDETKLEDWCDLTGTPVIDGTLTVYKAVDGDLCSGRSFAYPIGTEVSDSRWRDDHDCGGGLHFSPSPMAAKAHFSEATRFLQCTVDASEVRCIDSSKLKAPRATVVREVTLWREPVGAAAVSA